MEIKMNQLFRKYAYGTLLASLMAFGTFNANAEEESAHSISANVLLATEYLYRGLTQTNEDPAIQGGFDYAHASGFYIGTWASSLEFNPSTSNAASLELNYYAGYGFDLAGLSYDLGYLYYHYTGQNEDAGGGDYDFWEIYGSVGKEFGGSLAPSVSVGFAWSPDFYGEDDDGIYVNGSFGLSLPAGISPYFNIGYQDVSGDKTTPAGFDYWHYAIGASKDVGPLTLDISWNDADNYCSGNQDACEAVVFSVSSSF
jgi:uncharacterized protein (TIGR02001 family)